MRNADMPAMPVTLDPGEVWSETQDHAHGLTKREYLAAHAKLDGDAVTFTSQESLNDFLGRNVDAEDVEDMTKASMEIQAKLSVMYADALLAELEKTQ